MTYTITGVTRKSDSTPLGGCTCWLFKTSDDSYQASTTSDVNGVYTFTVADNTTQYWVHAYKDGSPNLFGRTDNNLQGS